VERTRAAEEFDGWKMTAVSAYLLKAGAAYWAPFAGGLSFMLLFEVQDIPGTLGAEACKRAGLHAAVVFGLQLTFRLALAARRRVDNRLTDGCDYGCIPISTG
jgi:hypothetical protein